MDVTLLVVSQQALLVGKAWLAARAARTSCRASTAVGWGAPGALKEHPAQQGTLCVTALPPGRSDSLCATVARPVHNGRLASAALCRVCVQVGDSVAPGDMLCEVETDKATIAWEAQEEGFVAALLLPDGAKEVAVGAPAAVLVEDQVRRAAAAEERGGGEGCHC